ncbi:unnamed protein product [Prorocentrum cordatum]|uniref:Uncharacterized protein n=1 Tax=Prorocentrum cordatum TaxID=2364126 RepID=A0ABN9V6H8_9DINO|nr:unnamed protein product [Polarella glacialis]
MCLAPFLRSHVHPLPRPRGLGSGGATSLACAAARFAPRARRPPNRRFAGGHAFVLLVLFAPPLTLCASLLVSLDVVFFVGRWWLSPLLLLPLALIFPLLTVVRPRPTGLILASVLTPCVVFILVGAHYASHTEVAVTTLRRVAIASPWTTRRSWRVPTRSLSKFTAGAPRRSWAQRAWQAAPATGRRPSSTAGAGADSSPPVARGSQFDYLESLEVRFPCAGICHRGLRLWGPGRGQEAPSCGLFVAEWMGAAHTQAEMVLAYSTVVALAAIPGTTVVLQPFLQNWYMRNAWPQL